jgi:hypothetical protein
MASLSRREFLKGVAAAGAVAAVGGRPALAGGAPPKKVCGSDVVPLGKTEARPTVLGIGTGTRGGSEQRHMGSDAFAHLVRHALDRGVRYIDTADAYMMHTFVRLALRDVKRDEYFLLTKVRAKHPLVARADLDRFRRELHTDYFDVVLMHCMQRPGWPDQMRPVLDVLLEEKQKGRIKAVGVSCHGWKGLAPSVACPDLDVHLVRTNPFGKMMDGKPDAVAAEMQKMHAKGRGVIGMKVFGETGFGSKAERLESLRYILGLGCVDCFTIGFSKPEQIDETLALIEQASREVQTSRAAAAGPFAA